MRERERRRKRVKRSEKERGRESERERKREWGERVKEGECKNITKNQNTTKSNTFATVYNCITD